ncbi:hypothetical protein ZIOFF_024799 [Zingiber officinale]|uniref:Transcription factor HY5 n=1 Tax=Zingiber officinale TaxID=94328 RepID=A0A8J5L6H1_ZINOF|nr:hypothetical protein ZIOFF_024799 [Zingiber officinale]
MLQEQGNSSLPSSSERSSSSALQMEVKEGKSLIISGLCLIMAIALEMFRMESDEEIGRVPDFGFELAGPSTSGREAASAAGPERAQSTAQSGQQRRGRSPADKEHKRLKRLLRNRVSAQQARERKKAYLTDLEAKVKDLEARNSELEERMSTLQNENNMLRQVWLAFSSMVYKTSVWPSFTRISRIILKNTTVGRRGTGSSVSGEGM